MQYDEGTLPVERQYDIVLYGASGFTGKQTVEYCREHAPPGLRWAIAGRNRGKLEAVNRSGADIIVADAQDDKALNRLAAATRIVLSTAGPFSIYGTKLVDACVRNRTHYCDITGETPWIRRLIDHHHERAAADGTKIIPCCGFDSIPSDYGAWLISRHIRETMHLKCAKVSAYFKIAGGANGGTLATAYHLSETGEIAQTRDPFLLDPDPAAHAAVEVARNADPTGAHFDKDLNAWVAPFIMGSINTRVVRRTQALLATPFDYQEYARFDGAVMARLVSGGSKVFEAILGSGFGRWMIKPLLPPPGAGPDEKTMNEGFFELTLIGHADDGRQVRGILKGKGDPGNRVTVKCLCESAFVLASAGEAVPGAGGILTPVSGLGDALVPRMAAAGITFELV